MAQPNPMARKHPWIMTVGILAGVAAAAVAILAVMLFVAFSSFMGSF